MVDYTEKLRCPLSAQLLYREFITVLPTDIVLINVNIKQEHYKFVSAILSFLSQD